MLIRNVTCCALLAGLAGAPVFAGDCEPVWDPTFGVPGANSGIVFDFALHEDDGGCLELYASGSFTSIGGTPANRVARWDGSAWSALGAGLSNAECYAVAGYGGDLYAAGYFDLAGGVPGTAKIARWDGAGWHSLGAGLELFSNQLWDLVTWDDGTGEALYVFGNFQNAGGVANADFIARYDGKGFSGLGAPIGGAVPLITFAGYAWDDGSGEALYVGGRFLSVGGIPASRIAKWDGTSWAALGSGLTGPGATPSVMSMVAFDDGAGEQIYVAGQTFNSAGGVPVSRIARWDGAEWSAVGAGFADGIVWGLEVFDDGNGAALYAFGTFTASGATPLTGIAKWNGASWEPVDGGANDDTYHATVFDDGSGRAMYVGGTYTTIGEIAANRIARLHACPGDVVEGDVNGDGLVNVEDLVAVITAWGPCACPAECPEDVDGSGAVDVADLVAVVLNWS